MIFIKEHFDKILEAYDADYKKMDNAWGSQKDPNKFSKLVSNIEPKIPSLQIPDDALKSYKKNKNISRKELRDLEETDFRKIIAILAWGGIRENNFIACISGVPSGNLEKINNRYKVKNLESKTYSNINNIEKVVNKITNDDYSNRVDMYNDFFELKDEIGKLVQLGQVDEAIALLADQKSARDARYAARKARKGGKRARKAQALM